MKKPIVSIIASLLGVFLLASCNREKEAPKETTKPTITFLDSEPHAHEHDGVYEMSVRTGNNFRWDLRFEDNEALNEARINIHDAEDGHTHRTMDGKPKWYKDTVISLSGKLVNWSHTFSVPSNVWAGPYHGIIKVLDKAGNESDFLEIDLKIIDAEAPYLTITSSIVDKKIARGQIITFSGVVFDNADLAGGTITIHMHGPNDREFAHEEISIPSDFTGNTFTFVTQITVPSNAPLGIYMFHIEAIDSKDHVYEVHLEAKLE